jgi:hypothetical protein
VIELEIFIHDKTPSKERYNIQKKLEKEWRLNMRGAL